MQAQPGIFGKLPAHGDFIARGLASGVRPVLDRFLTMRLARYAATPDLWPAGGLRATLSGPAGEALLLCILPSCDAARREFPLACCVLLNAAPLDEADRWADAVYPVLQTANAADDIPPAIANIPPPQSGSTSIMVPAIWGSNASPSEPTQALRGIFGA